MSEPYPNQDHDREYPQQPKHELKPAPLGYNPRVYPRDRVSLAYFLSDPACKTLYLFL